MPDTPTTRLSLYKSASDGSEDVDYTQDIGGNWDILDLAVGYLACTAATRPSTPYNGQAIRETDTGRLWVSNGSSPASGSWSEICVPGAQQTFTTNVGVSRAATTNPAFRALVTADSQDRFQIAADGKIKWGSGAAVTDTSLYRDSAGSLTTDGALNVGGDLTVTGDLVADNFEETMAWTDLEDIGTFASGFAANVRTPRMRKVWLFGTEQWEFEGRIDITSLTANTSKTAFTFDSGYIVGTERGFQQYASNTAFYGMRVSFTTGGLLSIGVPTGGGSSASGVLLDGIVITNPLA